jgi:hypothetical protein
VINKPRGRGGHSLRWAAEPEIIIIIILILINIVKGYVFQYAGPKIPIPFVQKFGLICKK